MIPIPSPVCLCGHPYHDHYVDGVVSRQCSRRPCGCLWFRTGAVTGDSKDATTGRDCQQECDADCEIGPVHCWNRHRPNHKPDWHDGAACDAATRGAG